MNLSSRVRPGTSEQAPEVIPVRGAGSAWWADARLGLLVLVAVLVAGFGAARPEFFNQQFVLSPLLRDISVYTIVGLAQMVVLSIGHMNLAVGRMAAFGAMFMGISFDHLHLPLYAGLLVGLAAGAGIGALTGMIIARTQVNSFVVTLAMDFTLLGLIPLVYSALTEDAAFTTKPAGMSELRQYTLGDLCIGNVCGSPAVPQMALIALAAVAAVAYLYTATRPGRELLLTGANESAARLSGIRTDRIVILAHALSGGLAALAGFLYAVNAGSFRASIGEEFMLPSFLGPILGGTLLAGGAVSALGTALGTSLTLVIRKGLELVGVGLDTLNIYLGVVLLLALSADRVRDLLTRRRSLRAQRASIHPQEGSA